MGHPVWLNAAHARCLFSNVGGVTLPILSPWGEVDDAVPVHIGRRAALVCKAEHPEWNDSQVAADCGISPKRLSDYPKYTRLRDAIDRGDVPESFSQADDEE